MPLVFDVLDLRISQRAGRELLDRLMLIQKATIDASKRRAAATHDEPPPPLRRVK